MRRQPKPISDAELRRLFGEPGQYQKGSIDRMNLLRYPAEPDDIGYMRGWYARLASQVHTEVANYDEIVPVLDALERDWQRVCTEHGWPNKEGLPL